MVDALREVRRVLAPGAVLVDARPDSRVMAYVERPRGSGFQRFGIVRTNRFELVSDRASDLAVAEVVRERLFKRKRRGRLWHRAAFGSLAEVREYLREHLRFVHRPAWVVDVVTRRKHSSEPFVIRRAVRYEVLEAGAPR